MRYAVFDLGSNSIKFLVAEVSGRGLHVVEEESIATRLAEDLLHSGELKAEAMTRTLTALRQLRSKVEAHGVAHCAAVATSAVRDSKNRKQFLKQAREVLGFPVQLLSGSEEGEMIFAGVAADPHWRKRDLLVVDVGGGSAEWVQGRGQIIERRMSLPLGCVRLRERFVTHYPVGQATVEKLGAMLHEQLQPALASYRLEKRILVGTGGTMTCLAAMEQKMKRYDPQKVDHFNLRRADIGERLQRLSTLTLHQLKRVSGLPAKRVDLIIPGAAVFYVTMEILGAQRVAASVRGLRYGVLQALVKKHA